MADNLYMKLAQMRVELQKMNIKKSGWNDYSKYYYYELGDILPPINELQEKYKTCSVISFTNEEAVMTLINSENPEEKLLFASPMAELTLKAAHPVQNLGGVETYQRRYLYMTAFEIVENDWFDATQGKEKQPPPKQKNTQQKPKTAPKATAKISEATANELNKAVKEVSIKAGITPKEVTAILAKELGKNMSQIDENDAKVIFERLNNWAKQYE